MQRDPKHIASERAMKPVSDGKLAAFARGFLAFFQSVYAGYLALVVIATIAIAPVQLSF